MNGKKRILFYNNNDGSGAIRQITEDGGLGSPGGEITGLDLGGWTHVTFVGRRLLFYSILNRSGQTAEINQAGRLIPLKKEEDLGAWTHIASNGQRWLFYSNLNRSGQTAEINQAGDLVPLKKIEEGAFGQWTHIATGGLHGLRFLFYSSVTRLGATAHINFDGDLRTLKSIKAEDLGASGWSHVASGDPHLLFYNNLNLSGATGTISPSNDVAIHKEIGAGQFAAWTHIA